MLLNERGERLRRVSRNATHLPKMPLYIDVARECANALWLGYPVLVGTNEGKFGEGTAIRYRGRSAQNRPALDRVEFVDRYIDGNQYRMSDDVGRILDTFTSWQQTYEALLREIRAPLFRVIQFSDPYVGNARTQLYARSIDYGNDAARR